jgi:hypothetical protein
VPYCAMRIVVSDISVVTPRKLVLAADLMTYLLREHVETFNLFRSVPPIGLGGEGDSEQSLWYAGLSCLSRSSNQTNEADQRNKMDQIPATRREMLDCKT